VNLSSGLSPNISVKDIFVERISTIVRRVLAQVEASLRLVR